MSRSPSPGISRCIALLALLAQFAVITPAWSHHSEPENPENQETVTESQSSLHAHHDTDEEEKHQDDGHDCCETANECVCPAGTCTAVSAITCTPSQNNQLGAVKSFNGHYFQVRLTPSYTPLYRPPIHA